jgi:hypothetical protein
VIKPKTNIRELEMQEWINNHIPEENTSTKLYYEEYVKYLSGRKPLNQGTFNDYVVDQGFIKTEDKDAGRMWKIDYNSEVTKKRLQNNEKK